MLILRESKAPVLRMYGNVNGEEEDWLTVLSSEEMETAEAVRIVGLEEKSVQKIQNCAAVASRRNPNFSYRYENSGAEEQEDFRTRIMAEMMAGGGPDILYVSPEDMELLYNMGLLADLRTLLPEETLEQVLPGVVGLGSVDGTLAGLAPEVSVGTLITLKEIWQEDTWRLEDILGLMETGDFTGIICQGSGGYAPRALLKWLTAYSFENSFLIDWETGKCHFEDERFLKILEYAKKYAEAEPDRSVYGLGIGGCVADTLAGSSLEQFNNNYEKFGDDYYFVGLPTEGESGNYLFCNGVAVVNRNLSNPEAVVNYLECLIGKEVQYMEYANAQLPVRRILRRISVIPMTERKATGMGNCWWSRRTAAGFCRISILFWKAAFPVPGCMKIWRPLSGRRPRATLKEIRPQRRRPGLSTTVSSYIWMRDNSDSERGRLIHPAVFFLRPLSANDFSIKIL